MDRHDNNEVHNVLCPFLSILAITVHGGGSCDRACGGLAVLRSGNRPVLYEQVVIGPTTRCR